MTRDGLGPGCPPLFLGYRLIVNLLCVQATGVVLAHLTDEKRKHGHVLWVNLQDELVLEGNGQIFTPREPSCMDQHIPIPLSDPQQIEVE